MDLPFHFNQRPNVPKAKYAVACQEDYLYMRGTVEGGMTVDITTKSNVCNVIVGKYYGMKEPFNGWNLKQIVTSMFSSIGKTLCEKPDKTNVF